MRYYIAQAPNAGSQIVGSVSEGVEWAKTASIYLIAILMATAVIGYVIHGNK